MSVARASLEKLLLDYEDFLRHRRLLQWSVDSAEATAVRDIGRRGAFGDRTDRSDRTDLLLVEPLLSAGLFGMLYMVRQALWAGATIDG